MEQPLRPTAEMADEWPTTARWAPSAARRIGRDPRVHWLVFAALAAVTGLTVYQITASAEQLRAAYGETVEVLQITTATAPGDDLAEHTRPASLPRALVPADAVTTLPAGGVALRAISAGAVLTRQDIHGRNLPRSGEAAVAVPVGSTTPPVVPGQGVLVIVHADPFAGNPGDLIEGTVLSVDADRLLVTVPREALETLGAALAGNGVTIAIT